MTTDQLTKILATILVIEMMAAIGLGVMIEDLTRVIRDWRLTIRAMLANYVCFPGVTVGLLLLFQPANPAVAAGFLILAVCPGAAFGPACTRIAGGDVPTSVGLMASLALSSALAAPVLLHTLLSLLAGGRALQMDVGWIPVTLLMMQLLPMCLGVVLRHWPPGIAERMQIPANSISAVLSLAVIGLNLCTQIDQLAQIRLRG